MVERRTIRREDVERLEATLESLGDKLDDADRELILSAFNVAGDVIAERAVAEGDPERTEESVLALPSSFSSSLTSALFKGPGAPPQLRVVDSSPDD